MSLLGYDHRYGFNGKEGDDEIKGDDNQQDYGMRIYDPRAGRFLSVDPITRGFAWWTPYQFAGNSPISGIDLDGLEYVDANRALFDIISGDIWFDLMDASRIHSNVYSLPTMPIAGKSSKGSYLGYSVPFYSLKLERQPEPVPAPNFDGSHDDPPSLDPRRDVAQQQTGHLIKRNKDGGLNKISERNWEKSNATPPISGSSALAKGSLAMVAYGLYAENKARYDIADAREDVSSQSYLVKKVLLDVSKAIRKGLVDEKFQNVNDLSTIANILYQGNASGASSNLIGVAMNIAYQISGTAEKAFIKTFPQGNKFIARESMTELYKQYKAEYESNIPKSNGSIESTILWKEKGN